MRTFSTSHSCFNSILYITGLPIMGRGILASHFSSLQAHIAWLMPSDPRINFPFFPFPSSGFLSVFHVGSHSFHTSSYLPLESDGKTVLN